MMIDTFGRIHDYLRISLTDNCNLRCFYCMPDEDHVVTPAERLMQADEITGIAQIFTGLGVRKIRLTGGEPLVRKDAGAIIRGLAALPAALTMTTNGILLHDHIENLTAAGIRTVNISLDTLRADRFLQLTKRDRFDKVRHNIDLMLAAGFQVKVNTVVMKGLNDDEIPDFIQWTRAQPVHVRFIEFMPFQGNRWQSQRVMTWQEILSLVTQTWDIAPIERLPHDTAKKYQVPGHAGTFAVISTMSAPFCSDCNRLRLTADGRMKNCLFSQTETDLLTPFRAGKDITPLILQNVLDKKEALGGQFTPDHTRIDTGRIENRSMISIGG